MPKLTADSASRVLCVPQLPASIGRRSWRLPPLADDFARQLAPLPWLFAFVALVCWLPITLNDVLDTPLNGVISNLAPTVAFAIACLISLHLLRRPAREPHREAESQDVPDRRDLASGRSARLGLLGVMAVALLVVLVVSGYLALARAIAGQAVWAAIVLVSAYLLFRFADDLWMALLSSRSRFRQRLRRGLGVTSQALDQAVRTTLARIRTAVGPTAFTLPTPTSLRRLRVDREHSRPLLTRPKPAVLQ
jgi:small-conductance mechanosensitive channel